MFIIIDLVSFVSMSQTKDVKFINRSDIYIKNKNLLFVNSRYVVCNLDTICIGKDTTYTKIVFCTEIDKKTRTKIFYDSIKHKACKKRYTKSLYKLLFKKQKKKKDTSIIEKKENQYLKYKSKIIRKIHVKRIDVFGESFDTSIIKNTNLLGKLGNRLHINTKERIIRNSFLIKQGEPLNPYILADNERLFRNLDNINDIRININQIGNTDSVDVTFLIQDLWSIGLDARIKNYDNYDIKIYDANFLGLGRKIENNIYYNSKESLPYGYSANIGVSNIQKSFVSAKLNYLNAFSEEYFRLNFYRPFISSKIKYAGGFKFEKYINHIDATTTDTGIVEIPVSYYNHDLWIGRSFTINKRGLMNNNKRKLYLSTRYIYKKYKKKFDVQEDDNLKFFDQHLFLTSVSYSKQSYYKTKMVYGFNRTEDIPYGHLVSLTFGRNYNEFYKQYYCGLTLSKAAYVSKFGYINSYFSFGTYIRDKKMQLGIVKFHLNYFSNLHKFRNYYVRQFINLKYIKGINSLNNDSLKINSSDGIRGLNTNIYGQTAMAFNIETVLVTPWYYWGFNFAIFIFYDIATIGDKTNLFENKLYSGIGLGIRITNENMVINTLQLRIAYYPKSPADIKPFLLNISTGKSLKLNNFEGQIPSLIDKE